MNTSSGVERCYMVDFRQWDETKIPPCHRIYFGHETCEKLLPDFHEIRRLLEWAELENIGLTFVTPFLTDAGIKKTMRFLEQLQLVTPTVEVVVSDWGLLNLLASNNLGKPVISRFLTGQQTDFRLKRFGSRSEDKVLSIDGKYYKLIHKEISQEMTEHLSSCTLLKKQTLTFLERLKIDRFELSNTLIPVKLPDNESYHYSLHLPFVPLSIFRSCPGRFDPDHSGQGCTPHHCRHNRDRWLNPGSGCEIHCRDNALYYFHSEYESKLQKNSQIDRVIFNATD